MTEKLRIKNEKLKIKIRWVKPLIFSFVFSFFILHPSSFIVFAQPLSSTELINNAAQYDGKIVEYEGEAIGEVMQRGAYGWVNINDGINALGIWADVNLLIEINFIGSYKTIGDRIKVTGKFNRACAVHGGDLDIHAEEITKIKSGALTPQITAVNKEILAVSLSGALLCLMLISLIFRRKPGKK